MAVHTTTKLALRYPDLAEPADVPAYIEDLAEDVDTKVAGWYTPNTFANRPAAGKAGMFYFATDTKQVFLDDGATWNFVNPDRGYGTAFPTTNLYNGLKYTISSSFYIPQMYTVEWEFIYRYDLDTMHPWLFKGGAPGCVWAGNAGVMGLHVPFSGEWMVTAGGYVHCDAANASITLPQSQDAISNGTNFVSVTQTVPMVNLQANYLLEVTMGGTNPNGYGYVSVLPISVAG